MANKMYQFSEYCGRMGSLSGLFIADEAEVAAAIGKLVHFGEVLGKHSDISVTLDVSNFKVLTDDQDFIAKCKQYGIGHQGHCPLSALADQEEDD